MAHTTGKDWLQIVAAVATIFGALAAIVGVPVAAYSILQSESTFKKQTNIQADQSAYEAVQAHMQLRVEHSEVRAIEDPLVEPPVPSNKELKKELNEMERNNLPQFTLYVAVAEHGIAMAEYVYLLEGDDPGWVQTVESWVRTYRPFLVGDELYDCRDWNEEFISFVDTTLGPHTQKKGFCYNLK